MQEPATIRKTNNPKFFSNNSFSSSDVGLPNVRFLSVVEITVTVSALIVVDSSEVTLVVVSVKDGYICTVSVIEGVISDVEGEKVVRAGSSTGTFTVYGFEISVDFDVSPLLVLIEEVGPNPRKGGVNVCSLDVEKLTLADELSIRDGRTVDTITGVDTTEGSVTGETAAISDAGLVSEYAVVAAGSVCEIVVDSTSVCSNVGDNLISVSSEEEIAKVEVHPDANSAVDSMEEIVASELCIVGIVSIIPD